MKSSSHLVVATAALALCGPPVAQEHPVIKPIKGFVLRPAAQQKVTNFDQFRFRRKDAQGRDEFFVKKGKFWGLDYHKPAPDGGATGASPRSRSSTTTWPR